MSSKVWTVRALLMILLSLAVMAVIVFGGKPEKPEIIVAPKLAALTWNQFPNANFPRGRQRTPQRSARQFDATCNKSGSLPNAVAPQVEPVARAGFPGVKHSGVGKPAHATSSGGGSGCALPQAQSTLRASVNVDKNVLKYRPNYKLVSVDQTNYGERYTKDANGIPVYNQSIIVLHETANSATSAINFFQTPHLDNGRQASYHTMIALDGTVVYLVSPDKRAFGAANSVFDGPNGPETVKTNPSLPPSVNNFAYHSAFETPPDGWNRAKTHSGYTDAQYNSLAWLLAQSNVPDERITTHRAVDRSGQRIDPRSFDFEKFLTLLHFYRLANAAGS